MFSKIEIMGDRLLARLVPRARAAASHCRVRPSGCSTSSSGCSGHCVRCCFSYPPPISCTGCQYRR